MDPETAFDLGVLPGTTINVDPASAYPVAGQTGTAAGTGAGRFGLNPLVSNGGGTVGAAVEEVWDWLNRPFTTVMSPTGVFLMVGSILVAVLIWNLLLYHIRIAAESL